MMNLQYYREVDRLQDNRDFQTGFQTDLLVSLMSQPRKEDNDCKMVLLNRLEAELRYLNRKNVYVVMKWLIFIHQIIQKSTSQEAMESISYLLDQMTSPAGTQKIDQYLLKILISPYKQYLKKLAWRRQLHQQEGQNLNLNDSNFQIYSEYNFINYALTEFAAPIREFTSFFSQEYPYLNCYIDLIGLDLSPLYRTVLQAFQENLIVKVTFIEVEKMGNQMQLLIRDKKGKKELLATADNSNSSSQNRPEPFNTDQITPFPNLESSNLTFINNN